MRRLFATASILALSAGAANAGKFEEPVVEPEIEAAPAPAPAFNWTGAYAGLGVGVTNMRDRVSLNPTFDVDGSGAGIFGFAGYNLQLDNNFVVGVEGDIGYNQGTASGARQADNGDAAEAEARLRTTGSLRMRAGYAMDRTLFYGTGGVAVGRYKATSSMAEFSETRTGWTIGAGVEQALQGGWSIRGEYRYTDFGSSTIGDDDRGINEIDTRLRTHEVRVGAALRF